MMDAILYGGCNTCSHRLGETKCRDCFWNGKSQRNTHWEPKEPFINKPCISEGVCHEDKMQVLEKIKAEIEHMIPFSKEALSMKLGMLEIIDKYMKESEEV